MRRIIVYLAVFVVQGAQAQAQDLVCKGLNVVEPGAGATLVSLEVSRDTAGQWHLVHARLNRRGADKAAAIGVQDGSFAVSLNTLESTYSGTIASNARSIRGSWTGDGKVVPLVLQCSATPLAAQDTSPHRARFIAVERDVQLEVLDWGGEGPPIILLHGMSATAHDFDAFATKLTLRHRVYAISRRGSGNSSRPEGGYSSDRLGDDVVAVMDSLGLRQATLMGHSFGGAQLSSVASRFADRVTALVYLDAANAYAYVDPARSNPFDAGNEGGWLCPCSLVERLNMGMQAYRTISVPVLAIFAVNANWTTDSGDGWTNAVQAAEFERGVRTARVVRIPNAAHYVFRSHEADVIREITSFLEQLPTRSR